MNEANFLSCFNLITEAHKCQMYIGDDMIEVKGTIDQRNKCNVALEEILGSYLYFDDIPETACGWPI